MKTDAPISGLERLWRLFGGSILAVLGGWLFVEVSIFGLIVSLLGIAVASLGVLPANRPWSQGLVETEGSSAVRSFPVFAVTLLATIVAIVDFVVLRISSLLVITPNVGPSRNLDLGSNPEGRMVRGLA